MAKKMSKALTIALVFSLIMSLFSVSAVATGAEAPDWTAETVVIDTAAELMEFAKITRGEHETVAQSAFDEQIVQLGADIDLSSIYWYQRGEDGTVVSDYRIAKFEGVFDGNGKTISNLKYLDEYAEASNEVALTFFQTLSSNSTIKNLTINNITALTAAPTRFSGLADDGGNNANGISNAYVTNCTVKNISVNAVNPSAPVVVGGMFWKVLGSPVIENCHVENITVNAAGPMNANNGRSGGFMATGGEGGSRFEDCTVTNLKVTAAQGGTRIAGFVAGTGGATYDGCKVTGFVLASAGPFTDIGGFIADTAGNGWQYPLVVDDCHVSGLDVDSPSNGSGSAMTGGFIGRLRDGFQGSGTVSNCTAAGKIAGADICGGFFSGVFKDRNFAVSNCYADVAVVTEGYAGGFLGATNNVTTVKTTFTNCSASGDVTGVERSGINFIDTDPNTVDGIIGGTYSYDPGDADPQNVVADGYEALDNGNGTWTVFPDVKDAESGETYGVKKVAFWRFNEEGEYENWRTVEVFEGTAFDGTDYVCDSKYDVYRFDGALAELNAEAVANTDRPFLYWTDVTLTAKPELAADTIVSADMNVYAQYGYTVSYEYTGDVPAGAPAVPAAQDYEIGDAVTVAEAPSMNGYTFSGWDKADFTMPAEDVVITGSWTRNQVNPTPNPTPSRPVVTNYTVTVNYVDENGAQLAAPYVYTAASGSSYNVTAATSTAIEGYVVMAIDGDVTGILDGDKVITVTYGVEEVIEDPDAPPMAETPDVGGDTADEEEEEDTIIEDEDVPMADVPETGDMSALWAAASVVSAVGIMFLGKKNKDEE